MHVRVHVFISCWCVQSASSNPPATLPEEIIHCQYLLTSDCVHRTHTHTHTQSQCPHIAHCHTQMHTYSLQSQHSPSHHTSQHSTSYPPLPLFWVHMHTDVQRQTHTYTHKTDADTSCISIQGVLHCLSVYDTHAWWPMGAERPVLLMEYDTLTAHMHTHTHIKEHSHLKEHTQIHTNTHEYNKHNMHNMLFTGVRECNLGYENIKWTNCRMRQE